MCNLKIDDVQSHLRLLVFTLLKYTITMHSNVNYKNTSIDLLKT